MSRENKTNVAKVERNWNGIDEGIFCEVKAEDNVLTVCFSLAESGGLPDLVPTFSQKCVMFPLCMHYFPFTLCTKQKHYRLVKPSRWKSYPYHATYLCTLNVETEALLAWDLIMITSNA